MTTDNDKLEYTTVGELIDKLSKFDRNLPVATCEALPTRIDVRQERLGVKSGDWRWTVEEYEILDDPEFWKDYKNVMDCVVIC